MLWCCQEPASAKGAGIEVVKIRHAMEPEETKVPFEPPEPPQQRQQQKKAQSHRQQQQQQPQDPADELFAMFDQQVEPGRPRERFPKAKGFPGDSHRGGSMTPSNTSNSSASLQPAENINSRQTTASSYRQENSAPRFQRWNQEGPQQPQAISTEPMTPRRSGEANMSKEERLQNVVRDFTGEAQKGIRVELIDVETQLLSQTLMTVDKQLEVLTLKQAFSNERVFSMRDLRGVFKGAEFKKKVMKLEHLSHVCIGMEFASDPQNPPCFHFKDQATRDEFYTCLKVLKMCSDNLVATPRRG